MQFPVNHKVCIRHARAFAHLASLDARELFSTKYAGVGHGTVGYADRSEAASQPLMPFLLSGAFSGESNEISAKTP